MTLSEELDAPNENIQDLGYMPGNFTQIPNIITSGYIELDPLAFRLYCAYKHIAWDRGNCTKSSSTLSKECGMSVRSIQRAKKILSEPQEKLGGLPLITIESSFKVTSDGKHKQSTDIVKITNIWPENTAHYIESDREFRDKGMVKKTKKIATPRQTVTHPMTHSHPSHDSQSLNKDLPEQDLENKQTGVPPDPLLSLFFKPLTTELGLSATDASKLIAIDTKNRLAEFIPYVKDKKPGNPYAYIKTLIDKDAELPKPAEKTYSNKTEATRDLATQLIKKGIGKQSYESDDIFVFGSYRLNIREPRDARAVIRGSIEEGLTIPAILNELCPC